jgi:hypothetical protein
MPRNFTNSFAKNVGIGIVTTDANRYSTITLSHGSMHSTRTSAISST